MIIIIVSIKKNKPAGDISDLSSDKSLENMLEKASLTQSTASSQHSAFTIL